MVKKETKKKVPKAPTKKIVSPEDVKPRSPKFIFLKEICLNLVGKNAGAVVDLLFNKENVNEFLIADKLGLTINQTRNVLYKLSDNGLVSFARKKR